MSEHRDMPPELKMLVEGTGGFLYRNRRYAELTQKDLADKAGVNRNTISRIEGGDRNTLAATLASITSIAGALGYNVKISFQQKGQEDEE